MIGENMEKLLSKLLQLTQTKKIIWLPLSAHEKGTTLMVEYLQREKYASFESEIKFVDYSLCSSYYVSHQKGLFILADILYQRGKNEPFFHQLRLLTKINNALPVADYGCYDTFAEKLEVLKLCIERNIYEEYPQPDTLYAFWNSL